jgi:hypothetical protein
MEIGWTKSHRGYLWVLESNNSIRKYQNLKIKIKKINFVKKEIESEGNKK